MGKRRVAAVAIEYGGSGDPERSLELLWGLKEPGSRGPKPKLTVAGITAAAIALADQNGMAALSLRKVAEELGVGTMSLYTYVPSKSELIDVMTDAVYGEVVTELSPSAEVNSPSEPGQSSDAARPSELGRPSDVPPWRVELERIANAQWAMYHRHPWLVEISGARPILGPNLSAKYEIELTAIDGIGLTDLEMDGVVALISGHVDGSARQFWEARQIRKQSGLSDEQWWERWAPALERMPNLGNFPIGSRVGQAAGEAYQSASSPEHHFTFGLQRLLDGIQVLVDARR